MILTLQKVKDSIKKEIDKLNLFKGQFYTTFKDSQTITWQSQKQFQQKLKSLSNALSQKEQSLILKLILIRQWHQNIITVGKDCTHTEIQNQYQTVILKTCDRYHPFTLKKLLMWKYDKRQYFCPICKKGTRDTNDIIPDALSQIYFRFGSHTNVRLLINKTKMTPPNVSDEIQQRQKQLQLQHNILTSLISFSSHYYQITLKFLKCEDDQMLDQLAKNYDLLMKKDDHKQYRDKIKTENYHVNLISTNTYKYILHPVFHKECLPQNHSNKLIAFNLQEILTTIKKGKTMKCPYPTCPNQFTTVDDLRKKGIIMPVFQKKIFQAQKYFMFGLFLQKRDFQFINQRIQTRFKLEYDLDVAKKIDQDTFKKSMLMFQNYFTTKESKFEKYVQKYQQTFNNERYIKFQLVQNENNHYSDNSFLYVICNYCLKKTKNINKNRPIKIRQYLKFISSHCRSTNIKCPDCLTDISHDRLSDTYLPDFNFSFFAYFQNRMPNGIYIYDMKKKSYLNNISNTSPESIKITLSNLKRQISLQNIAKQDKVDLKKKYLENLKPIVCIHEKCQTKEQALLFIYKRNNKSEVKMFDKFDINLSTVTAQDIESEGLKCPVCLEQLQINDLLYEKTITEKNFARSFSEEQVKGQFEQNSDNRNQYDIKQGKRQMKMKQQNQKIVLTNRIKELESENRELQLKYQQLLQNYSREIAELTNQKKELEKKLKGFQIQQNNKNYQIQQYVSRIPTIHPGISIIKKPTKIGHNKQYCYHENIKNQLGHGTFGTVYQCYKQSNPSQKLAVKVFKDKLHQIKQQQRKYFQGEQKALKNLKNHDNILNFIEFYVDPDNKIYLITEKCDRSLAKQIQQTKKQHQKKIFQYSKEIVSAMKYMIDNKFMHRDLKPLNILIKNNHVKIADFGLAKLIEGNQEQSKTYFGTLFYQSPQLLYGKKYTCKCDVWAVGCIIFQMLTGHRLFNNLREIQEKIKQRNSPHQTQIKNELKHFTSFWQKLILQMLCYKQEDRKTFVEIEEMLFQIEANCELFK